jgi:arylsulfatase A-like enzyme
LDARLDSPLPTLYGSGLSASTWGQVTSMRGTGRIGGVLGCVAALVVLSSTPRAHAVQERKPNIIFILGDDLGYGDIGPFGQQQILTPNLDRLAAEGLKFTHAYAGAAVCAPSRSVLMTGLHTGHTPIRANAGTFPLRADDVTIAEVLRRAGYRSGGFGKWGLGDAGSAGVPTRHGFTEFFGYLHQIHAHTYYPEFLWDNERKHPLPGNVNGGRGEYSAELIAERALRFIRQHRDQPFFLYAAFTLPHGRFEVPDDKPYSGRDWPQPEKNFASMVTRLDGYVGRIMALVAELQLDRDTIVFFASDNGGVSGEGHDVKRFRSNGPFRGENGSLYEGGIRVPMIVRWPGRVAANTTSDVPWAFWDFLPTAAAIAGTRAPDGLDGISVLPTILGGKAAGGEQAGREFLYWEHQQFDRQAFALRSGAMIQAVRTGNWKAVRPKPGAALELYDLARDAGESSDVAAAHPAVIARIESFLKTARTAPRPHDTGSFEYKR